MNVLEHTVVKVMSKPYSINNAWFIDVIANCYGTKHETTVVKFSEEEIKEVKPGYKFVE